jgi:hypothetical protein
MKLLRFVAIALWFVLAAASAPPARAQTEIQTPITSGDQLIFFYDATAGHVPFLVVSNISSSTLTIDIGWYSQDLSQRIATQTMLVAAGGNVVLDGSQVDGVSGHAGLAVVTPVDDSGRPVVPFPPAGTLLSGAVGSLVGGFTLADLSTGGAFGSNPIGRIAVNAADGSHAAPGSIVDGTTIFYQRFAANTLIAPFYFNPSSGVPVASSVVLVAFGDQYGAGGFNIGPGMIALDYEMADAKGNQVQAAEVAVTGVILATIPALAGGVPLQSSGKVVFHNSTVLLPPDTNVFGVISQSLGTFGVGQVMPGYFSEGN